MKSNVNKVIIIYLSSEHDYIYYYVCIFSFALKKMYQYLKKSIHKPSLLEKNYAKTAAKIILFEAF